MKRGAKNVVLKNCPVLRLIEQLKSLKCMLPSLFFEEMVRRKVLR